MFERWIQWITPKKVEGPTRRYGIMAIAASCGSAFAVLLRGTGLEALALPLLTILLVVYRYELFFGLQIAFSFFLIAVSEIGWSPDSIGGNAIFDAWPVIPIILQTIFSLRVLALEQVFSYQYRRPFFSVGLPFERDDSSRQRESVTRDKETFREQEVTVSLFVTVGVFVAAGAILVFVHALPFRPQSLALLTVGMRMVLLVFGLSGLFLVMYVFVNYGALRKMTSSEGRFILQMEIWKWFRKEQGILIKHRRIQRKKREVRKVGTQSHRSERKTTIKKKGKWR